MEFDDKLLEQASISSSTEQKNKLLEGLTHQDTLELEYRFNNRFDARKFVNGNEWTLKTMRDYLGIEVTCDRTNEVLTFSGSVVRVKMAYNFMVQLSQTRSFSDGFEPKDFEMQLSAFIAYGGNVSLLEIRKTSITIPNTEILIYPKTPKQFEYIRSIRDYDVSLGVGGAGTGKTFLAVAEGLNALLSKRVKHLIICRPAIEADENLGFLPGDMEEKIRPYMQPCFDALNNLIGESQVKELIEEGKIKTQVLAFARGITWEDSYVIIDEAQNTSEAQMKLIVTRFGFCNKIVINGDLTQIDRKFGSSGLIQLIRLIKNAKQILQSREATSSTEDSLLLEQLNDKVNVVNFSNRDVVRSNIAKIFVSLYDALDEYKRSDTCYQAKIDELTSGLF